MRRQILKVGNPIKLRRGRSVENPIAFVNLHSRVSSLTSSIHSLKFITKQLLRLPPNQSKGQPASIQKWKKVQDRSSLAKS
jgi:hypothetical protein